MKMWLRSSGGSEASITSGEDAVDGDKPSLAPQLAHQHPADLLLRL